VSVIAMGLRQATEGDFPSFHQFQLGVDPIERPAPWLLPLYNLESWALEETQARE